MKINHGPKVLYLDIETAPNEGYFWGLFRQNIAISQIKKPGYTLCWAAKWGHNDEVHFAGLFTHSMEEMLQEMWDLLDEADVVVHYNGKKFDVPTLNREFEKHGMLPPAPYDQIDLYWVVRSNFRFASNKLDFVCQELGIGAKVQHKGQQLWTDCMAGVELYDFGDDVPEHIHESWGTMQEYNEEDVRLLPKLYERLRPWIKNHPNMALWMDPDEEPKCTHCGSTNLRFKGYKRTKVLAYKQYLCNDCGTYSRARTADESFRGRKDVLR